MKFEMLPVISCYDLEEAVNLQYDCNIEDITLLLYGDDFANNSYKNFYFKELDEYKGYPWQDEETIRLINLVKSYLQDIFPHYDHCLIDVSW